MNRALILCACLFMTAGASWAQTNVTTQHNDIGRTGQNRTETILTPANVNPSGFGKLFSVAVDGQLYAQPLYLTGVTMGAGTPQAGTKHNVVFAATENATIYAFDADNNGGASASPLWKITLLDAAHGAPAGAFAGVGSDTGTSDITPSIAITGTPVIDPNTNTLYVVGKTRENYVYFQRLHALDVTTGAEKFGGPAAINAQVSGNGNGSSGGVLKFDTKWENQRPGLLLLNGYVYIGFAAHGDNGPWHGWILSYNASTLQQAGVYCTTPNGSGSGIWMSGAGLAADTVSNSSGNPSPGGRVFVATGNGAFTATSKPYNNTMSYGDDLLRLDLNNGSMTVGDQFTPLNQSGLNSKDQDVSAGGVLIFPDQTAGGHLHLMLQAGKEGRIYLVDRDNPGGYNSTSDNIVQEVPVNNVAQTNQNFKLAGGMWSMPAYWNNKVFFWATNDYLKSFSFTNGLLGNLDGNGLPSPTSTSSESSSFPGATPAISANGASNGIVWTVRTDNYASSGQAILQAHDAANVATTLYSSTQNPTRDNPGIATKFTVPTITNGKVYVGTSNYLSVFGLLGGAQQAAAPVINPGGQAFTGTLSVTITDSTPGSSIYYTTDGSTPTTSSPKYTGAISVNTTMTLKAVASASGYLQSSITSETYTLQSQTIAPTFSPAAGSYNAAQSITIADATSGAAAIYYTTDGTTPTQNSGTTKLYAGPFTLSASATVKAIATHSGLSNSPVSSSTYTIVAGGTGINFNTGFSTSASVMAFNGSTVLNDTRLQLTDGLPGEAGTAWFKTPVNITNFTNDFTFQLANPLGDGITFTIQNVGTTALGPTGGGLGYGPDAVGGTGGIAKSIAIKFDLYSNNGEGADSTGLYQNAASPTTPAVDMTGSGIDLHSGNTFSVHMTYSGSTLTMKITDLVTNASFSTSWSINIAQVIGSSTAYVGFTGGTGGATSSQKIETWTYLTTTSGTQQTATAPIFSPSAGTYTSTQNVSITTPTSGASIYYSTDGSTPTTASKLYSGAVSVSSSLTIKAIAVATSYTNSAVSSAAYTINIPTGTTISLGGGFTAGSVFLNGNASLNGTRLRITGGTSNEDGSAWYNSAVNIQQFTTAFSFQVQPGTSPTGDGFTFTIQRAGTTAIGPGGGGLGYGPDAVTNPSSSSHPPISSSLAIKFDLYDNAGEGTNSTGLYLNGASPTTPAIALTGVDLHSSHVFNVKMSYDGTNLAMTVTDASTNTSYSKTWPVNIPNVVGATTAYVGFTGASGGLTAIQEILSWTLSSTATSPAPSINFGSGFTSSGLQFNGAARLSGSRLQLTDTASTGEAGSVFSTTKLNAQAFTTDFTVQLLSAAADGFTFTLQGTGTTALGPSGGGLGYGPDAVGGTPGIGKSVAIKFDLYDNNGEGANSTGLYLNGVSPTTPAATLGNGVNLLSGDVFKVHITYDGTTLRMNITDTSNAAQNSSSAWVVNIPNYVGGTTAYAGFTGGTGGLTALQNIITWTMTSP